VFATGSNVQTSAFLESKEVEVLSEGGRGEDNELEVSPDTVYIYVLWSKRIEL
jgi:hypothetical protein